MLNLAFKVSHLKSMVDLFHEKAEVLTEVSCDVIASIVYHELSDPDPVTNLNKTKNGLNIDEI